MSYEIRFVSHYCQLLRCLCGFRRHHRTITAQGPVAPAIGNNRAYRTQHNRPGAGLSLMVCLTLLAWSTPGTAQSILEEILVTATKRTESLQTVPLSISAISGDTLEAHGMTEFLDYAVTIPNLSFGAAFDGVLSGHTALRTAIEPLLIDQPAAQRVDLYGDGCVLG